MSLRALVPSPRLVAERVDSLSTWSIQGGRVRPGVRAERTIRRVRVGGQQRIRAEVAWHDSAGGVTSRTTVVADLATLAPLLVRLRAERDSASLAAVEGRLVGWSVSLSGEQRLHDQPLVAGVIAPELEDAAIASLPLKAGLEGTVDLLNAFGQVQRRELSVTGPDTLTAAGAVRDCWLVTLSGSGPHEASMTMWVDRASRRVWQKRGDYPSFSWYHRVINP